MGQLERKLFDKKCLQKMNISKKGDAGQEQPVKFTERQKNIVRAWAAHATIADAAQAMGISEHTFQTHLRRMRKKIDASRSFEVYTYLKKYQQI